MPFVSVQWKFKADRCRTRLWRLNNFLLEALRANDRLQNDILEFYGWSNGIARTTLIWDMCKAFLRSKFIALKAFRDKEKGLARPKLKLGIERLEYETKHNPSKDKVEQLDTAYDTLKLIDVHHIAQEVLSGKQKLFECRDRPNKLLPRILSDHSPRRQNTPLEDLGGKIKHSVNGKLEAFQEYFQTLYTAEKVDNLKDFLTP